jgi:hypothetical protein
MHNTILIGVFVIFALGAWYVLTRKKIGNPLKRLTWKLLLPLTIISFTIVTKWWHVEVDGSQEILRGFPLPFVSPGWHTSLSLQLFVFELIVDILFYFSFWFFIIVIATKIVKPFHIPKPVTITLLVTAGLFMVVLLLLAINPDNIYTTTRPFDIEVKETEYRFMWQD